jgi:hypothetical protein
MLQSIGNFVGNISDYVVALLALVVLYFLWVAFREWRTGKQAAFSIERDIASSEVIGAVGRAGVVVVAGLVVFGLGKLGHEVGSPDPTAGPGTPPVQATLPVFNTPTQGSGGQTPSPVATNVSQPEETLVPLPSLAPTQPPVVEPTRQTAQVTEFGGVWLRDAPNGGTIQVMPQGTVVEFLEGRQVGGAYEWQLVRILNTPAGSEALVGLEGWAAAEFLKTGP